MPSSTCRPRRPYSATADGEATPRARRQSAAGDPGARPRATTTSRSHHGCPPPALCASETDTNLCPMTTFEERYDPAIAEAMLQASSAAGGLPAHLGIEHVRFEPGRFFAKATIAPELLTPFGNAHGGVTAAIVDHVTGVVVYP